VGYTTAERARGGWRARRATRVRDGDGQQTISDDVLRAGRLMKTHCRRRRMIKTVASAREPFCLRALNETGDFL